MATYSPSKITKDGNTYNFTDDTKIPLAGSNAISGSLIPATDNSIDIGSSTKNIKTLYTKGITIDGKTIDTDSTGNMTYDGHIVDTIEEQGNGYIRYTNGIQICWGSLSWQSACSASWGALYETSAVSGSYAKSFVGIPSVSALGYVGTFTAFVEANAGSGTSTPTFYLCRGTTRNDVTECSIRYMAIGCWK